MAADYVIIYSESVSMEYGVIRTQIQLTESQAQALKAQSAKTGLSIAEIIRRSIDQTLHSNAISDEERRRRAIAMPAFHSGRSDIAANHDEYFAEAIEARIRGDAQDRRA